MLRLEADVKELQGKVERRELRALGAEREVGFLQALVVRFCSAYDPASEAEHILFARQATQRKRTQRPISTLLWLPPPSAK